ncbi:ClpP/crotonase-like domain-containing protein [Microdochium trichocladiopsis]|uniref:ClpP/crotonase-like domain-containing protein n=1 Tax=Microdochium trichocladiopsis TaxID=1682393 RepID=A0A9P8YBB7_9PEZI|nr:ClpP/crotonase-like domain-containing protein [Microdochium trichocladiopsis]KAH7032978.1 ClpP/crotonase-like domain-containing protein [Microdochium trichocladiopsis]
MSGQQLFTVPIPALKNHPGGAIVCTTPAPKVYLLSWTSPPDNRLTDAFCQALLTALDELEYARVEDTASKDKDPAASTKKPKYPPGVVITTSAITKFYSNGLDLTLLLNQPGFAQENIYPLWRRFLTYPMPTVALLNGHTFAGGAMLAMHQDYRVFSEPKGYLCLNELEFGAPLLPPMASVFREKLPAPTFRKLILEAHRFGAKEALDAGIVDKVGGLDAALELIRDLKLTTKAATGAYGMLKEEMYRESVALLDARGADFVEPNMRFGAAKRKVEEGVKRVEGKEHKAKL